MKRPGLLWGASLGGVAGYATAALLNLPSLAFFPRLGEWGLTGSHAPDEIAIRWYGWLLWSIAGAVLGAGAGSLLRQRPSWTVVWALALVALALLGWHEREWFLK